MKLKSDDSKNGSVYWTKERMGPSGWTILHLITTKLPSKLTPEEQNQYKIFMHLFAKFYPCEQCSEHFKQLLIDNPINVTSRQEAIQYMCKAHNIVNEMLHKKQFPCETDEIFEKWGGKEECGCKKNVTITLTPVQQQKIEQNNVWQNVQTKIQTEEINHLEVLNKKRQQVLSQDKVWA